MEIVSVCVQMYGKKPRFMFGKANLFFAFLSFIRNFGLQPRLLALGKPNLFFAFLSFIRNFALMKVYVFNPENDMALADGRPGYTPPALIRQMRSDLSWLPKWWAEEDDVVWDGTSPLHLSPGDEICPWGWSLALVHQLSQAGVDASFLPSADALERLRQLSHRRTAVEALHQQQADGLCGPLLRGESLLCQSIDQLFPVSDTSERLFKSPWSSSGRGLMPSGQPAARAWCRRILRQQGSVVAESRLDKLADFGMLFRLDGAGGVEYRGLSLFHTNESGAYTGSWLASEGEKLSWLMQYVPPQVLADVRHWWEQHLTRYAYRGPLGVDMMLTADGGICPCVEVNWRMTMGHVAQLLTEQGHRGKLLVHYIYGQFCAEVEAFQ